MKVDCSHYFELRRQIHAHPELSNQEHETTRRIGAFLAQHGLQLQSIPGLTGGFVRIDTGAPRTLCLRADIDALPLTEDTGAPFSSQTPGVMHACGHDMHTSIAAGVACELAKKKDQLHCNLVILFQPAEENNPTGGAKPVVESGFLTDQHIDEIYGLHMWPSLPVGDIAVKAGPIMAASDKFRVEIFGKTSHAAEPHLGVDAISIGNDICLTLTQKLRREVDAFSPISISIGSFQTFGRYNIVCGKAVLEGTMRTTNEQTRAFLQQRIQEVPPQIAHSYRGSAQVTISPGYGVVSNDPDLFHTFLPCAQQVLGAEHVHSDIHPSLIGEDFYYFGTQVPALYFHVGCQSEYPLHSNHFLPREEALSVAVDLMTEYFLSL